MKAQELRIGNLIYARTTLHSWDAICSITGLNHKGIYVKYGNGYIIPIKINPIPLSEEWLLKFGFEKCLFFRDDVYSNEENTAHNSYRIDGYDCDILLKDPINSLERQIARNDTVGGHGFDVHAEFKENNCHIANINYVHQLQNLYFALTGKEL